MVDEMLRQILEENVNFSSIERQDERIGIKHFPVLVRSTTQEPLRPSQEEVDRLVGELHEVCSSITAALEAMAIKLSDLRPYRPLRPHDSNPMSSWAPADCMQRVDLMDSQDRHELPSRCLSWSSASLTWLQDCETAVRGAGGHVRELVSGSASQRAQNGEGESNLADARHEPTERNLRGEAREDEAGKRREGRAGESTIGSCK